MTLETPAEILSHHADADAVDSFVKWRKSIKKPLTERAAVLIAVTLRTINAENGDATEALDLAQEHGWQTIKADWYWRIKNGNGTANRTKDTRANAASNAITFAGAAHRAPSKDCF